jgi:septum formation protein
MLILASQSPRRKQLLEWTGWSFEIIPASNVENVRPGEAPLDYVRRMSSEKAAAIVSQIKGNGIVLAADTVVVLDGKILGKPESNDQANEFLRELRGKIHFVSTSIFIEDPETKGIEQEICTSQVKMREYTEREMQTYIATGDPQDKAGAYAVQHKGFHPVQNFRGCLANVMGLPLCHLVRTMAKLGVYPPQDVPFACQKNLDYDCPVTSKILKGENVG